MFCSKKIVLGNLFAYFFGRRNDLRVKGLNWSYFKHKYINLKFDWELFTNDVHSFKLKDSIIFLKKILKIYEIDFWCQTSQKVKHHFQTVPHPFSCKYSRFLPFSTLKFNIICYIKCLKHFNIFFVHKTTKMESIFDAQLSLKFEPFFLFIILISGACE